MSNPSPAAVAAIRAQVPTFPGGWSGSDIDLVEAAGYALRVTIDVHRP